MLVRDLCSVLFSQCSWCSSEEKNSFAESYCAAHDPPPVASALCQPAGAASLSARAISLHEVIGEGAVGRVVAARIRGRRAAVKIVDLSRYPDPESIANEVRLEVEILAALSQHHRVVEFLGVATIGASVLIAMEQCAGSLRGLLFGEARLRGSLRVAMVRQVAAGMAFLHSRGVLHRDLKPENVLVASFDQAAQSAELKISDFGLSTQQHSFLLQTKALTLTAMIGTPLYMSPELMVAQRRTRYGAHADIYSFGLVAWSMWSRRAPFRGPAHAHLTPTAVMDAIKKGDRPRIEETTPVLVRRLVEQCWDPVPDKRPDSFVTIINLLEDHPLDELQREADDLLDATDDDDDLASRLSRDSHLDKLADGAQQLLDLQALDRDRKAALEAAGRGRLDALVGWVASVPTLGARVAIIGVVSKRKLLVRLEDGSEKVLKPILGPLPTAKSARAKTNTSKLFRRVPKLLASGRRHGRPGGDTRKDDYCHAPITLLERVRLV